MPYRYGIKNTYRPSSLAPHAYGFSPGANYNPADVPSQWVSPDSSLTDDILKQQFAYEWFQSSDNFVGFPGDGGFSNPPFVSGAAGRLHPSLTDTHGKPARILRGYIRRAEYDKGDSLSKARLYFMFNPETITRDYVSYLEQSALDPFNTVYQSGNLIAPPSIMNFSFELFFDRQEEAMSDKHPGVFVDYQFFDMVVRNVHPDPATLSGGAIPDNGVMMVNPRDITVIFSPQLSVQGRPTNAQVTFEKFTHRMTPIRMRIRLTILASYFGPVKDMVEYKAEELPSEVSIPLDGIDRTVYDITWIDVEGATNAAAVKEQMGVADDANHKIRKKALEWALTQTGNLNNSALIATAYNEIKQAEVMGWTNEEIGVSTMMNTTSGNTSVFIALDAIDWKKVLLPGDILISDKYAAFFVKYNGENAVTFSAGAVGEVTQEGYGPYTYLIRPTPLGSLSTASTGSNFNSPPSSVTTAPGVKTKSEVVSVVAAPGNTILLAPAAAQGFANWKTAWGGDIPCTSGWRDPAVQQAAYEQNSKRFAPADKSWHCKGAAVDVDNNWLSALSAANKTKLRQAAYTTGWGQCRYRQEIGVTPGFECPCNPSNGTKTDEPWHFSYGGCG